MWSLVTLCTLLIILLYVVNFHSVESFLEEEDCNPKSLVKLSDVEQEWEVCIWEYRCVVVRYTHVHLHNRVHGIV